MFLYAARFAQQSRHRASRSCNAVPQDTHANADGTAAALQEGVLMPRRKLPPTPPGLKHANARVLRKEAAQYSPDDALQALRAAFKQIGVSSDTDPQELFLSKVLYEAWRETRRKPRPSADAIILWWGSWINACANAGVQAAGRGAIPKSKILTSLAHAFAETRGTREQAASPNNITDQGTKPFTRSDYAQWRTTNPGHPYDRLVPVGEWESWCEQAGMPPAASATRVKSILHDTNTLTGFLQQAAKDLDLHPLSARRYQVWASSNSAPSLSTVQNRFGSWTQAAQAAGIDLNQPISTRT